MPTHSQERHQETRFEADAARSVAAASVRPYAEPSKDPGGPRGGRPSPPPKPPDRTVATVQQTSSHRTVPVIRLLVADDHPVVRHGLKQILSATSDVVIVGEATNASEVLDHVRRNVCDVLLLDLAMPGSHGLGILEAVKRERPHLPVLVLTMHPADQYAVRVLRAGAAGYMTKESAAEEVVQAVRKVYAGGKYLTTPVAEALAAHLDPDDERPPHELLSNREYQVFCLVVKALSVKDIARQLHLSEKTVSTYRCRVLEKMQARSTAQLIRYAFQHGLVD